MIESKHYTQGFYQSQQAGSYVSAQKVLPIVNAVFKPASVVDIGCGVGYWLKVWQEDIGVREIMGIEGPYVTPDMLKIPADLVRFQDLKDSFQLNKRFDLAMSLEVAEHLPAAQAEKFVEALTQASDIILFSAAIIGQEGTYHVNEQMPEYWAKIFAKFNYVPVDFIRPKIWNNEAVDWWYRQNALLYIRKERLQDFPELAEAYSATDPDYLLRIQPWLYMYHQRYITKTRSWQGYAGWKFYKLKQLFKKQKN